MKKRIIVLVSCVAMLFINGCKENVENEHGNELLSKELLHSELKKNEWFTFIDSIYTYPIERELVFDSVSLYFMKKNTPSVISSSKYIFWKNKKQLKSGEFNLFIPTIDSKYLIVSNGRRNVIVKEIAFNSTKMKESKSEIFNLNDDNLLKDPCYQISKIEHNISRRDIVLKIEIFQSCFDQYSYKELIYPIP